MSSTANRQQQIPSGSKNVHPPCFLVALEVISPVRNGVLQGRDRQLSLQRPACLHTHLAFRSSGCPIVSRGSEARRRPHIPGRRFSLFFQKDCTGEGSQLEETTFLSKMDEPLGIAELAGSTFVLFPPFPIQCSPSPVQSIALCASRWTFCRSSALIAR